MEQMEKEKREESKENGEESVNDSIPQPIKYCIKCGKPIPIDLPRYSMRKYCSKRCCSMVAALKYYHKVKDSPKYKSYRKDYYKKWFKENRTALIRKYAKKKRKMEEESN